MIAATRDYCAGYGDGTGPIRVLIEYLQQEKDAVLL